MERERERERVLSIHHSQSSVQSSLLCPGTANWSLINLMELVLFIRGEILQTPSTPAPAPVNKQPADIDVSEPEPGSHRSADV